MIRTKPYDTTCQLRTLSISLAALFLIIGCNGVPANPDPGELRPSEKTGVAPAQSPSMAKALVNPQSSEVVIIKPNKPVPLATTEVDLECTNIVAPFKLSDNATILADLGLSSVLETFGMMFDQWIKGTSSQLASQSAIVAAQHKIPFQLRAAAVRMNWLPMEAEVFYGRTVLKTLQEAGNIMPIDSEQGKINYPLAQALLETTLKGIDEPYDYKFEIHVADNQGQNALALPGGIIVLDSALVSDPKLKQKSQFAVAHEIAHILQRHETRALQARIIDTVSLRSTLPDLAKVIGEAKNSPTAVVALLLTGKLQFERYFVRQELHSDGCAVKMLHQTVRDDVKLIDILKSFIASLPKPKKENISDPTQDSTSAEPTRTTSTSPKLSKDLEDMIELVTRPVERHPTTIERLDNLNKTLAALRKSLPTPKSATPKVTTPKRTTVIKRSLGDNSTSSR